MDKKRVTELSIIANNVRKHALTAVYSAASGHPGGSLSVADVLTLLYFEVMNVDPKNPKMEDRDRFVLSKGHTAPALYGVLAEKGFIPKEDIKTFRNVNSYLQGHPDMNKVPGVDMSTGSLGQGVSAAHYKLDNFTIFVDNNGLQIDGDISKVMNPNPIDKKFEAFGWHVIKVSAHNFEELMAAVDEAKATKGQPTAIIMKSVKGKNVSFMENNAGWHGSAPNEEQYNQAIAELDKIIKGLEASL